jgi:CRP/FNR family transcriptional regulator, anaerobic regulatory protein
MVEPTQFNRIAAALPVLQRADPGLAREFAQAAWIARIPAGRDVFVEGDHVDAIALLISGVVRVYKLGETGREITLCRFGLGQSCILTANAILSRQSFPAIATVEQDAEAVMIPADTLRDRVRRYDLWRGFVFDLRLPFVFKQTYLPAPTNRRGRAAGLHGQKYPTTLTKAAP